MAHPKASRKSQREISSSLAAMYEPAGGDGLAGPTVHGGRLYRANRDQGGTSSIGGPRLLGIGVPWDPIEREFFTDNILVRIHLIMSQMFFGRTGLAPWEFEFPLPGSLISTFLGDPTCRAVRIVVRE